MKDKMPEISDTCKIIRKYNDDNNMNIRFIKIRDLDHIISKMERKKEQTEMENRDAEKYKLTWSRNSVDGNTNGISEKTYYKSMVISC
jgi:hypothetical protein